MTLESIRSKLTPQVGAVIALLLLGLILTFSNEYFFSVTNFINIFRQTAVLGVAGVGATLVIISGGIDLSIGSMISLSGVMVASFIHGMQLNSVLAVVIVLGIGALLGLINGLLVTKLRIPPIIATLATLIAYQGVALVYTNGYAISLLGKFNLLGRGFIGPIPVPVVVMIVVYLLGVFIARKTTLGTIIYGLGGNEEAVRLSGISVTKYRNLIYVLSGVTAAIGGIVLASRLSSGEPTAGANMELDVIAAAVIGGTNIFGGIGKVWGTLIGAMIMMVINNGLNLMDVNIYSQQIAKGVILAAAVAINSMRQFQQD